MPTTPAPSTGTWSVAGLRVSAARGLTVLELLITLAIAAEILMIATPALERIALDAQRSAVLNEFLAAGLRLRGEAVAVRRQTVLCALRLAADGSPGCATSGGWDQGWFGFVDVDGNGAFGVGDRVVLQHAALPTGTSLRGNSKLARRILFKPAGVTANNGRIAYCDRRGWSEDARILVLSTAGRLRVLTRAQDASDPLKGCDP